jgi:hypothetical protein
MKIIKDEKFRENEKRLTRLYDQLEYHQNKINYLNLEIAKLEISKNEESEEN